MTAPAHAYEGKYSKWAKQECRFARNGVWNNSEVRDLIRCAAIRVDNSKDIDAALAIADRESGFNEHAENSSSSAGGLFQWLDSSWPGDRFPALSNNYKLPNSRFHPRAAAFVSLMVMKRYGCGAWAYSGSVLC
jgi:hypothetical protein